MKAITFSLFNIKHAVLIIAAASLLLSSTFMPVHKAEAATDIEALIAQVQQLMVVVLALQDQLAAMGGTSNTTSEPEGGFSINDFSVGDGVKATANLRVRSHAGTKYTGTEYNWVQNITAYTGGEVVDGPKYADGYTWWHIKYDNGTSGWSAENWLERTDVVYTYPSTPSCTIKVSDKTPNTGESFTVTWTTKNMDNPVFYEGLKAGGEYEIARSGSLKFNESSAYLGTFGINDGYNHDKTLCSVSVDIQAHDVSVKVKASNYNVTYGDDLKVYWTQYGSMPKGSRACVTLRRYSDGKYFAHPANGGSCVEISGKEPQRSVTGEVIRTSGYDLAPGKYYAEVTLHDAQYGEKDGPILASAESNVITVVEEYTENVEILRFDAEVNNEDINNLTISFSWSTVGTDRCYIHSENGSVSGSEGTSGSYELSRIAMTEKYEKDFKDGNNKFELRCQSAYTGKDSTVSDYETVHLDYGEDYKLTVNGVTEYEENNVTLTEATTQCFVDVNDYNSSSEHQYGDVARCYWGDLFFHYQDEWKG